MKAGKDNPEMRQDDEIRKSLVPRHGAYRRLKTFQLSELIYDVTVRFCEKYIDPHSRTCDQMIQAARSGRQNIAEGSVDSATSKKMEMKLTGVAKGSLEELRLDYEDYLRQRGLPKWKADYPALVRFKGRRCSNLQEFRAWVAEEVRLQEADTDGHGRTRTGAAFVRVRPCPSVLVANGALSLLNLCIYLLDRQLRSQAEAFERNGGFTECLHKVRRKRTDET